MGAAAAATPLGARSLVRGFTHGVASGEPSASAMLLWTRFVATQETQIEWVISENADLSKPVDSGTASAHPNRDFCVKTTASGLKPAHWYFFQFIAPDGSKSDIGRTRTLPQGSVPSFKMAVFSCSNLGFGWFNAYAHAARANDAHLALHLGDYIYEYQRGTYPSSSEAHPDRPLWPSDEIVTLADYRLRYANYRADPDLRRLHQVLPMIPIWDDHESTNDSWEGGAQNHQIASEGDWDVRKAIAKRVYREWMPVSDAPYAQYEVGDLATLFRLDTRLEGREEQFNLAKLVEGKDKPEELIAALSAFRDGDYANPQRQLLGAGQERWLADALKASASAGKTWQVLVQQVLMGTLSSPKGMVNLISDDMPAWLQQRLRVSALSAEAGLPLNMDAWDGYPAARERLFEAALAANANLLVLAGDTHNAWNFNLDHKGEKLGVELGVQSVSSPGFETNLRAIPPAALAGAVVGSNDQLVWADTANRGYCHVSLTPDAMEAEYRFTASLASRSAALVGTKKTTSKSGSKTLQIEA